MNNIIFKISIIFFEISMMFCMIVFHKNIMKLFKDVKEIYEIIEMSIRNDKLFAKNQENMFKMIKLNKDEIIKLQSKKKRAKKDEKHI